MEGRRRSKVRSSVDGDEREEVSKRRRTAVKEMRDSAGSGGRTTKMGQVSEEVEVEDTSSDTEYELESSESGGSSGGSESLEVESEFAEDIQEFEEEGETVRTRRRRGGNGMSVDQNLGSLWRSLEEAKLMDSSGSDFDGGDEFSVSSSPNVSLVDESDLESDSNSNAEEVEMRQKGVPAQDRRQQRKAIGDGVVRAGRSVEGEKGKSVAIRGRCILERIVSMNERLTDYQREAVMATVLKPILKYRPFAMERNLALALVKCWVPRSKAFRLGDRLVPFSVFDVALLTGLPATGEKVEFVDDGCTTEIAKLVRGRVHEEEQQELRRRKVSKDSKDSRVYKNFIGAMVYLCEQNGGEEQLDVWLKLYTWLVLSGFMFSHSVYVAEWEL